MEIFEIKNLSFCYPDTKKLVLDDINLIIKSSDFVLICGESGSGKTTLLRHFKEELVPFGKSKGTVNNKGVDVGFVMQDPDSQIVTDKVWHELAFGLENMGMKREEVKLRCGEIAAFFGIDGWYHKNTDELSGGQKQLLNLASVMAMKPDMVVLDEPLSQLDPLAAMEFVSVLERINRELGTSIVISEHNLNDVMPFAKKVVVMDKGQIIAEKEPEHIMAELKEREHIMQTAMPASMRIYSTVDKGRISPVTAAGCREWLSNNFEKRVINIEERKFGDIVIKGREIFFAYEKDMDIVRNMDIQVRQGEIFALLGGNGAGKTTALRVLAGLNRYYYGKLEIKGKTAMLPQNPISLFTEKSVLLDLKSTGRKIDDVVRLLEIEELLEQNPSDLSGGELQRCALGKILLTEPDILLLDEPTKGIDAFMKKRLGEVLIGLGLTIVMVSHDVEFCAGFADRCGLFFDGQIVNCCESHKFFSDNFFYTTAARRIASGIVDNAVTTEEVIKALGGNESAIRDKEKKRKLPDDMVNIREIQKRERAGKRLVLSVITIVLLIPMVIFCGMELFDDRKYYAVSMIIILLAMAPFFMLFESRRARAREIVLVAVMCMICVAGRVVFAGFPQIKPVLALVIISGLCLGGEAGFVTGALSGFCSNFYFGQGPWTPWQMFAFGIIGFMAGVMRKIFMNEKYEPKTTAVSVFGFICAVIIYGGIMNTANVFMYQPYPNFGQIVASIGTGLLFDAVHGISTAVFIGILVRPMTERIVRVKRKFGLLE